MAAVKCGSALNEKQTRSLSFLCRFSAAAAEWVEEVLGIFQHTEKCIVRLILLSERVG